MQKLVTVAAGCLICAVFVSALPEMASAQPVRRVRRVPPRTGMQAGPREVSPRQVVSRQGIRKKKQKKNYDWFNILLFGFLATGCIGFSLLMITRKSPMMAALSLLGVFLCLAGVYVQLEAPFMAFIQLIVYAGAVVVLFIFVIMSVGVAREEEGLPEVGTYLAGIFLTGAATLVLLYAESFRWTGFLLLNGLALGLFLWRLHPYPLTRFFGTAAASFAVVQLLRVVVRGRQPLPVTRSDYSSVEAVGRSIFKDNVFSFEALSLLLLAAIVAAVVLVRSGKQPSEESGGSEQ